MSNFTAERLLFNQTCNHFTVCTLQAFRVREQSKYGSQVFSLIGALIRVPPVFMVGHHTNNLSGGLSSKPRGTLAKFPSCFLFF